CSAVRRVDQILDIDTALEARARFGNEFQFPRRMPNARLIEVSDLEQYVCRTLADAGLQTAHYAADSDGFFRVTDREYCLIESPVDFIERFYCFACFRSPHDEPIFGELVEIERVHRLSELVHDVVGDVGDVVYRTLADRLEPFHQPLR